MPLPTMPRLARTAAAVAALALGLTACSQADEDPPTPDTAPTAGATQASDEPDASVVASGTHHRLQTQTDEVINRGRAGSASVPGATLVTDARTGKTHTVDLGPERFACLTPSVVPDSGLFAVMWPHPDTPYDEPVARGLNPCTVLTVIDGNTGEVTWRRDLDLDVQAASSHVGADEKVVVIADHDGENLCFDVMDGSPMPADTEACTDLAKQLA